MILFGVVEPDGVAVVTFQQALVNDLRFHLLLIVEQMETEGKEERRETTQPMLLVFVAS